MYNHPRPRFLRIQSTISGPIYYQQNPAILLEDDLSIPKKLKHKKRPLNKIHEDDRGLFKKVKKKTLKECNGKIYKMEEFNKSLSKAEKVKKTNNHLK